VRYGTMRDNVVALTAVTADGTIVRTARRARKTSAGYDLTRLLIGSEGTLGIITELTLRLQGIPEAIVSGVCPFPTVRQACDAVILTIQSGVPVARIELLDADAIRATNGYSKLALAETPTLFVEFHGSPAGVAADAERFGEIVGECGGGAFVSATRPEDRTRLWQARHDAYWAGRSLRPGTMPLSTDVCVPISRLADCVTGTAADIAELGLVTTIVGHVGDGNFHVLVMVDMESPIEVAATERFLERLAHRAISMDGTCTGEHGVGQGKMKYLPAELGPAVDMMRAVKRALDPDNILNPGKIFTL